MTSPIAIFPERKNYCITIQHNPRGTQGEKFAVTHEFAIYSLSKESEIYRRAHLDGEVSNFRKWGNQSNRSITARATTFFPVLVDDNMKIVGFGDVCPLSFHPQAANVRVGNLTHVYPIDRSGVEKKWRYSKKNESQVLPFLSVKDSDGIIDIQIQRESENTKTVWTDTIYNAEEYGTKLVNAILTREFPFPKSLYAVRDSLWYAVSGKPDALVVDFFAGSGTTLHAVNLLNAEDNGHRRCILVTNNEVSDAETRDLKTAGFQPGDTEWEKRGICRSVTWPRTEYSILGKRGDGTQLVGEYFTSLTTTKDVSRSFYQLGFVENPATLTTVAKKQIVALIGKDKLTQSLVKADSLFIVSVKHTASVLFDPDAVDDWLAALEEQEHITDFYIVTRESRIYNDIKAKVADLLGTVSITEPLKRPMSEGFPANVEYFKLGFLDKNSVSLGRQFYEILPLLWLKAGAAGERPELDGEDLPDMLILPQNSFAVLLDEDCYRAFAEALLERDDIGTVYFVTNSEEAFREMSDGIEIERTYQLYRDYIDNFVIGSRRNNQ